MLGCVSSKHSGSVEPPFCDIIRITDIYKGIQRKVGKVLDVFVDLFKAFDRIDHMTISSYISSHNIIPQRTKILQGSKRTMGKRCKLYHKDQY